MNREIDIEKVLKHAIIDVKFQPVVSVARKSVIGLKGISFGATLDGNFIPLDTLLTTARNADLEINLDRLIREKIFKEYNKVCTGDDKLLFLSINMAIIEQFVGSGLIQDVVNKYNINPQNVVLEIFENNIDDVEVLKEFITTYRSKGFLVSLTIGSGFANLDKLSNVEPDIIKISEAITKNIEVDFYKQEVFKSLVNLSKKLSAIVVAEGINLEAQSILATELGTDILQGDYFGEFTAISPKFLKACADKVEFTSSQYKKYKSEQITYEQSTHKACDDLLTSIIYELSTIDISSYDDKLQEAIDKHTDFECLYVLDNEGKQITSTVTRFKNMLAQNALVYKPAKKGTDHSLKKYYYFLNNLKLEKYVTEPYISLASGNLCITISEKFIGMDNKTYIICIDFNPNYITL
ncbi:EAL domain-containing protein [Clostridium cellulovorans]|uniref:Diguanylate phosphodiesterase n=1 Tax=Clostridium cellulovorans (strain ATCC 35296 / DSM 3052 / OCM 3 / 743B) TaxID=573061 RepID=D9SUE1_CLOC7|nr:EAL domain-containing protein [Clostridium cellulovorans]ADL52896.1 diguanylate phosphodiesterase [Clostridium cellulovorans 743B]